MFKYISLTLYSMSLILFVIPFYGGESAQSIIKKANHIAYYQGKDGRGQVSMTITDSQGRKKYRKFTILRRNESNGNQNYYVYFNRPADVRKIAFLVLKKMNKSDNRWIYLPALSLVKRIAASDKRTSFVGSDMLYEDVSGRNIADDRHKLIKTTKDYYVLKSTPKNRGSVEFSYYKAWIHRKSFVTVKIIYYDKSGREYRIYESLKVKTIQGYPTVTKMKMRNLKTNSQTVSVISKIKYNIGLTKNIFTERYLKRPPMKYLK